eukprot:1393975-Alexandrium_andersonii.AAC.1
MLQTGALIDIGNTPHLVQGQAPLRTCLAHGATVWKRRDFVLVDRDLLSWVQHVRVTETAGFDVHVPLIVSLRPGTNEV